MDDWQDLQDGLKTLVAAVSGISAHNIAWDGEPETRRSYPMAMLDLQAPGSDSGSDELRYETNDAGELVPVVVGNRVATLLVTVKSRDQRGRSKASSILERFRTRLEFPSAHEVLDELGVTVREVARRSVNRDAVSQQREESIAQLSITLAWRVEERDAEHPEQPVEHVQLLGEITTAPVEGETINTNTQADRVG